MVVAEQRGVFLQIAPTGLVHQCLPHLYCSCLWWVDLFRSLCIWSGSTVNGSVLL